MLFALAGLALAQDVEIPTENLSMLMEVVSADGPIVVFPRSESSLFAARALTRFTKVPFYIRKMSAGASDYKLGSTLLKTRSRCGVSLRDMSGPRFAVHLIGECQNRDLLSVAGGRAPEPIAVNEFDFEMIRRRRGSARTEMLIGLAATGVGLALIGGTAAAASGDNIERGPWTGLVAANSIGWIGTAVGIGITVHGASRMSTGRGGF